MALKARIEALLTRTGFKSQGVFVMRAKYQAHVSAEAAGKEKEVKAKCALARARALASY